MTSKDSQFGIFIKNELIGEGRGAPHTSQSEKSVRTVRFGQVVKIETNYTDGTLKVRCLLEDENWEASTFIVNDSSCIIFLPHKIWQFIAAISSPQDRVKLAKNKVLCQKLSTLSRDNLVGFIDNSDIRFGKIKYMGQVKGMGFCLGLELNDKKPNNKCDGSCAGIQYFKCTPGSGLFTTIERIHPISYSEITGYDDPDATITKTSSSFLNGSLDRPPREEIVTKFGEYSKKILPDKSVTYVRNSLSLQNISDAPSQNTVNTNNDFDQNTIIQPDKSYLMTDRQKNKSEMQLCDLIGTTWAGATDLDELENFSNLSLSRTTDLSKNLDKNDNYRHKSAVIQNNIGTLNHKKERNKSSNVLSHLLDGTNTLKKCKFYTHSNYDEANGKELNIKDTKISPKPKHKEERKSKCLFVLDLF